MRDFSHLNTGKFSGVKIWIFATLSSMILGGGFAFFLFYFEVETIEISREESDSNLRYGEILQMMELVKKSNMLVLSEEFLEKQVAIRFPELSTISVSKKFPRTLVVEAKTDPVKLKLVYEVEGSDEQYFGYLSARGLFFHNGEEGSFPVFEKDKREVFITPLEQVFSEQEISEILSAKVLLEEVTKRKITSVELLRDAQEIHFVDDQGIKYWMFLRNDVPAQLEKLRRALAEKNIYEFPLEYVDLRIGRKVIYKPK